MGLASARCARAATRFNRMWSKLDTDNSGTVTAKEWMGFFQKRFAKHGRKMSKRVAAHKMKHFKKWAGSKKYIAKKDVWAKIAKRALALPRLSRVTSPTAGSIAAC